MSGGVETNDTIVSGGLTVLTGGQANGTIVSSGGFMNLGQGPFNGQPGSAGGSASGTTISGGFETVLSGGVQTNATIVSGSISVLAGGQAIGTTVSSGANMALGQAPFNGQPGSAGGTATGTILSNAFEAVNSGGVDSGAKIVSGSNQVVSSGGVSINATISGTGTSRFPGERDASRAARPLAPLSAAAPGQHPVRRHADRRDHPERRQCAGRQRGVFNISAGKSSTTSSSNVGGTENILSGGNVDQLGGSGPSTARRRCVQ